MTKVLLLFSGGLDSILTAKILLAQKIKVTPLCFKSYFFDWELAKKSVKRLRLKLKVLDFSKEHLKIVKKPKYGHGKGMNPCIDCHFLMIKKAKEIMKKEKYDFIATGEVLGQRPFSQNKKIFQLIERRTNLKGLILRPLSAKLLPKTLAEERRIIKREKLFNFQGKSRTPQLLLAKKLKIKKFPSPAGGCILTDFDYSKKLRALLKNNPKTKGQDVELLRRGRVFWKNNFLILVGRNEKENKKIKKLKKKGDMILEPENFSGPTILITGFGKKIKKEILKKAQDLLLKYSKKISKIPQINVI